MSKSPDLDALLKLDNHRRGAKRKYTAAVAKERHREQARRASSANSKANQALARMYPTDYAALYDQALARVNAESGPLPGDEPF